MQSGEIEAIFLVNQALIRRFDKLDKHLKIFERQMEANKGSCERNYRRNQQN